MRIAAFFLTFTASTVFAAGPLATSCLKAPDTKECLVSVAMAAMATEKSAESRSDGHASLLSSLARAGVRRDDAYATAIDDESAPIRSRWSLAVARRTYALRFGLAGEDIAELIRIEAIATHLRGRSDGFDRLTVIWSACDAREDMPPTVLEKWDGILDRLCQMDDSDADALERGFPGLAAISAPIVDAFNRNEPALRRSLAISLDTLSQYEVALSGKMLAREREEIHGLLTIGHLLNAMALATTGRGAIASKAIETSLHHLRKAPSVAKAPEFQMVEMLASWIYAKAGMHDKAMQAIRKSLTMIDRMREGTAGVKARAIATAIETLRVLESLR